MSDAQMEFRGDLRRADGSMAPVAVVLDRDGFSFGTSGAAPVRAAYRDLATIGIDAGTVRVTLGQGAGAEQLAFERFGTHSAHLATLLRDGRFRQRLRDELVELAADTPTELVEYRATDRKGAIEAGIAQLVFHGRGVALAPLDESRGQLRVRRGAIASVEVTPAAGMVRVAAAPGRALDRRRGTVRLELTELGSVAQAIGNRWLALRDGAASDAAATVELLVPDAPYAARTAVASRLVEGRPVAPSDAGEAWPALEAAVLAEPTFAASFAELKQRAGGETGPRWLATAPTAPGQPEDPKLWFLVGLPGNLLALELVSGGAHATYLFRVEPRASYRGPGVAGDAALAAAVDDVSEALVDARFLREPMALPAEQLARPENRRYRLALAALPSLAAARARFVARLVHCDDGSWAKALDEVIAWHAGARDEAAEWPGRRAQETAITEAGGGDDFLPDDDASGS